MLEALRDTPAGLFLRALGFRVFLPYSEESKDFTPPSFTTVSDEPQSTGGLKACIDGAINSSHQAMDQNFEPSIVTWYDNDDKDNPRNWSSGKKAWVLLVVSLYTFVVYCAASIITPTVENVMQRYHISTEVATLGLSLYVFGYAVGPMIWSPLSEVHFIGRNPTYLYSFVIFFTISIVLAVVDNFPCIVVLRFLQGFFGSPALATGGASIEDIYDMYSAPYGYVWWVMAMYCGPALGPLLAGYATVNNWRWALWEVVLMSLPILVLLPLLPETQSTKIILNRARRLRRITGNKAYVASSELQPLNFGKTLLQALIKPIEISIKDPAITFTVIYCAIVYGTYYSFFEAFPLVYLGIYRMSLGSMGLVFTTNAIGCLVGLMAYVLYLKYLFIPKAKHQHQLRGVPVPQEQWLRPGLVGVWGVSLGLLMFAWTAREDIHWIVPTVGIGVWAATSFAVFQSMICYVVLSYPKYVASLFAGNDFYRSSAAAVMVQTTRYLYINLGIDRGVSLVAGLSGLGILGMYVLFWLGASLRARSKFSG
jgi:DHA1 family multidrug resistance protein-like MFS transporter